MLARCVGNKQQAVSSIAATSVGATRGKKSLDKLARDAESGLQYCTYCRFAGESKTVVCKLRKCERSAITAHDASGNLHRGGEEEAKEG